MSFSFAPYGIARVSGLPFDTLDGFKGRRTLAAAIDADTLLARVSREADRLCDRLHRTIAGEQETALRRDLLTIKRLIHNNRSTESTVAILGRPGIRIKDPHLESDVRCWNRLVRTYAEMEVQGGNAIACDLQDIGVQLERLWEAGPIAKGVLFAQPQLYLGVEKARSRSARWDRKSEAAILAYCYRAATKTSPFSTFTDVGIGQLFAGVTRQGERSALGRAFSDARSRTFLTASFVEKVARAIRVNPSYWDGLPVGTNALLTRRGGNIHFLGDPVRGSGPADSDEGEALRSVVATPAINLVLDLIEATMPNVVTVAELTRGLAERAGVVLDRARNLIERLVISGMLELKLDYIANDLQAIAGIAALLSTHPSEQVRRSAVAMTDMQAVVDDLRVSPARQSASLLGQLNTLASASLIDLGLELPEHPQPVLVRHNSLAASVIPMSEPSLHEFRPALSNLASVLRLFDADLETRIAIHDAFVERFGEDGECTDLLELFEAVHASPSMRGNDHEEVLLDRRAAIQSPVARSIREVRLAFIQALRGQCSDQQTVEIPVSFWTGWAEAAARVSPERSPLCVTFVGQMCSGSGRDSEWQFVLNKTLPGNGMPSAHYAADDETNAQRWLSETLRAWLPGLDEDAHVLELVGTFAFDGLIRPRFSGQVLAYPGEAGADCTADVVAWSDLAVTMAGCPGRLVLISKTTKRRVVPVHLGTLGSIHLPPFYRFVKSFGPAFSPDWSPVDFFEALADPREPTIRRYSRLVHQGVVLARETWCIPLEQVPQFATGESEFSYFRRLRRWAVDSGMPKRVFVTPMRTQDYLKSSLPAQSFRRAHKPFYVDWDDLVSHRLFRRFTSLGQGVLTIAEAMPDVSSAPFERDGHACNVEHVIELIGR